MMLLLASCVRYATDAEMAAARAPWVACVDSAVDRLDDGKADPATLAHGIELSCAALYAKVIEANLTGFQTQEGRAYLRRQLEDAAEPAVAASILAHRASRPPPPSAAAPATGSFKDAAAAYEHGDDATALRLLRPLAAEGNATAQVILGFMYANGNGVPQDHAEAITWFRKAAEQGDTKAEASLGLSYEFGIGVERDPAAAATWLRKAAAQGDVKAELYLASMLADGPRAQRNRAEAAQWYRKAADQGEVEAQSSLGLLYYRGDGIERDYVQAYKWLSLAAGQAPASEGTTGKAAARAEIVRLRDAVAAKLTPEQLAEAQRRAAEWQAARSGQ